MLAFDRPGHRGMNKVFLEDQIDADHQQPPASQANVHDLKIERYFPAQICPAPPSPRRFVACAARKKSM
jgi:hypothetical protein